MYRAEVSGSSSRTTRTEIKAPLQQQRRMMDNRFHGPDIWSSSPEARCYINSAIPRHHGDIGGPAVRDAPLIDMTRAGLPECSSMIEMLNHGKKKSEGKARGTGSTDATTHPLSGNIMKILHR